MDRTYQPGTVFRLSEDEEELASKKIHPSPLESSSASPLRTTNSSNTSFDDSINLEAKKSPEEQMFSNSMRNKKAKEQKENLNSTTLNNNEKHDNEATFEPSSPTEDSITTHRSLLQFPPQSEPKKLYSSRRRLSLEEELNIDGEIIDPQSPTPKPAPRSNLNLSSSLKDSSKFLRDSSSPTARKMVNFFIVEPTPSNSITPSTSSSSKNDEKINVLKTEDLIGLSNQSSRSDRFSDIDLMMNDEGCHVEDPNAARLKSQFPSPRLRTNSLNIRTPVSEPQKKFYDYAKKEANRKDRDPTSPMTTSSPGHSFSLRKTIEDFPSYKIKERLDYLNQSPSDYQKNQEKRGQNPIRASRESKIMNFSSKDDKTKKEEILNTYKLQCDTELRMFLRILSHQLSGSPTQQNQGLSLTPEQQKDCQEILERMARFAEAMMSLDLEEIKAGQCKRIVDSVQKLQQYCFKKKLPWRENVTKLLLIISRVSRLAEHLDFEEKDKDSKPPLTRSNSKSLSSSVDSNLTISMLREAVHQAEISSATAIGGNVTSPHSKALAQSTTAVLSQQYRIPSVKERAFAKRTPLSTPAESKTNEIETSPRSQTETNFKQQDFEPLFSPQKSMESPGQHAALLSPIVPTDSENLFSSVTSMPSPAVEHREIDSEPVMSSSPVHLLGRLIEKASSTDTVDSLNFSSSSNSEKDLSGFIQSETTSAAISHPNLNTSEPDATNNNNESVIAILWDKVKRWSIGGKRRSSEDIRSPIKVSNSEDEVAGKDMPVELICRICEELVALQDLEEHSKTCAINSKIGMRAIYCDDKMLKYAKVLDKRIEKSSYHDRLSNCLIGLKSVLMRAKQASLSTKENDRVIFDLINEVNNLVSAATLTKSSPDEETLRTYGDKIISVLKEKLALFEEISKGNEATQPEDDLRSSAFLNSQIGSGKPHTKDFEFLKPISKGAYGRVFLARKKKTGDLYAIKVLNKDDLRNKNQVAHIKAERNILASTHHPFIVKFYYSFKTKENLYMVMEYLNGGDLYSLLKNLGCFDEKMVRMYIAEVVVALEYLHSRGIIHRDLKPDNLLVGHDGHLKLTDFGLSKEGFGQVLYEQIYPEDTTLSTLMSPGTSPSTAIHLEEAILSESPPNDYLLSGESSRSGSQENFQIRNSSSSLSPLSPSSVRRRNNPPIRDQRRYSFVGTPDYLAPEVILGTGHGYGIDWWALGIIMFEFLTGIPPFNDETPTQIFENILNRNIPWPDVPSEMSEDAYDLINKLLTVVPEERLGYKGASAVKSHPFFEGINWEKLYNEPAVFIPNLTDNEDTSYFDETRNQFRFLEDSGSDSDENNQQDDFMNFSFKHLPNLEALTKNLMKTDSPNISPRPPFKQTTKR